MARRAIINKSQNLHVQLQNRKWALLRAASIIFVRGRKRILFFSETVTLAHLARPYILARQLNPLKWDIAFAVDFRFQKLFTNFTLPVFPIQSITPEQFEKNLWRGTPLYNKGTLINYVQDDLRVIDQFKPHLIVGDFRLSLGISCKLRNIPYVALSNVYWKHCYSERLPAPDILATHFLGPSLLESGFNAFSDQIFHIHAKSYQSAAKHYGLRVAGLDMVSLYTQGDFTAYADLPEFSRVKDLGNNEFFLGPVLWSPAIPLPDWWDLPPQQEKPMIYVNLGSSGKSTLLNQIFNYLDELDVVVLAGTGKEKLKTAHPKNKFYFSDYLPGDAAAARAALVICNGGSPTTYQALSQGVPVLGIASNFDQHLNMKTIESLGVGILLSSHSFSKQHFIKSVSIALEERDMKNRALEIQRKISSWDTQIHFCKILEEALLSTKKFSIEA